MGGFSQSSSKSSSKPVDITPPQYQALRDPTYSFLRDALGGGPTYSGPFTAGLSADERTGIDSLNSLVRGPSSGIGRGHLEDTIRGSYLTPDSNPFLRDYIAAAQRPIMEAFTDSQIAEKAAFAGAGHRLPSSSPFAYAEAVAQRGLASSLGDVSTRIAGEAYDRERGRQVNAVTQLSELDASQVKNQVEALRASALPRLIEQLGYDKGLEEFRRRVDLALQAAGLSGQLSSQFSNTSQSSSSSLGVQVQNPVTLTAGV